MDNELTANSQTNAIDIEFTIMHMTSQRIGNALLTINHYNESENKHTNTSHQIGNGFANAIN